MSAYGRQLVLGALSLLLLTALVAQSHNEAPKRWGRMPATEYVASHLDEYEGKTIIVDGTASGVSRSGGQVSFYLNPVAEGLFARLPVRAEGIELQEGQSGVNVEGTVINGVLEAHTVRVSPIPWFMEFVFNLSGFLFFLYFCAKEWRIKRNFPYIEEVS